MVGRHNLTVNHYFPLTLRDGDVDVGGLDAGEAGHHAAVAPRVAAARAGHVEPRLERAVAAVVDLDPGHGHGRDT